MNPHNPYNQHHENSTHETHTHNYSRDDYKIEIEYIIQLIYEFDERSEKDCEELGDTLDNSIKILEWMDDQNYVEIIGSIRPSLDSSDNSKDFFGMMLHIQEYHDIEDMYDKNGTIEYLQILKDELFWWVSDKDTTKPHGTQPKEEKKKNKQ